VQMSRGTAVLRDIFSGLHSFFVCCIICMCEFMGGCCITVSFVRRTEYNVF
jgi:hypothetical protein